MIKFERFDLSNGLKVLVHEDRSTPLVAVNILYDVGARDEDPSKTGFAHLFEHLMFGGSVNIPNYDGELEKVGGTNNAFTTNDITNYYLTVPSINMESAFWLESDRMLSLAFSEKSLEVQRNVVIEEFRERYLNQPYGDDWLLLRPLAYKVHPYQWATIGKEIAHIRDATLDDVKSFFKKFYSPSNATLVVSGNTDVKQVKILAEKWFAPIPSGSKYRRNLPAEPEQKEKRTLSVQRNVPYDSIYLTWHCCSRTDKEFYATDLITDVLSRGKSSRLYTRLLKEKKMFSEINAYQSGDLDKGLVIAEGKLVKGVRMEDAENAVLEEINKLASEGPGKSELSKVKNQVESSRVFSEMDITHKAMSLAYYELLGDAALVNSENERYNAVTEEEIKTVADKLFRETNCSVLYYHAN